jgi:hypothetical protein
VNHDEAVAVIRGLRTDMLDGYAALKDLLSYLEGFDETLSDEALARAERAHDLYSRVICAVRYLRKNEQLLFRHLDPLEEDNYVLMHARSINALAPDVRATAISILVEDIRNMAAAYQSITASSTE